MKGVFAFARTSHPARRVYQPAALPWRRSAWWAGRGARGGALDARGCPSRWSSGP